MRGSLEEHKCDSCLVQYVQKPRCNEAIEERVKVNGRTFDISVTPPLEEVEEAAARGCRFGAL